MKIKQISRNYYLKTQQGFSLVEIMLVLFIVGAIILLIANLPRSFELVGFSQHESVAKQVASKEIENVRSTTYTNLANGTSAITDPRIASLPGGSGEVTVSDCPVEMCTNSEAVKKVEVIIRWNENGKPRTTTVTTLVAQGGLQ